MILKSLYCADQSVAHVSSELTSTLEHSRVVRTHVFTAHDRYIHSSGTLVFAMRLRERFGANGRRIPAYIHPKRPSTSPGHPMPPLARPRAARPVSVRPGARMRCPPTLVLRIAFSCALIHTCSMQHAWEIASKHASRNTSTAVFPCQKAVHTAAHGAVRDSRRTQACGRVRSSDRGGGWRARRRRRRLEAEATVAREVAAKEVAATVEVATVAAPRVVPNRQYRRRKRWRGRRRRQTAASDSETQRAISTRSAGVLGGAGT